mmetsp:Transcript_8031/g.14459  ORF Transcript_8031/g.14459 Transcript_8031/m.14459 type:complete len:109 (+) Transcript_8031:828-1154(+)
MLGSMQTGSCDWMQRIGQTFASTLDHQCSLSTPHQILWTQQAHHMSPLPHVSALQVIQCRQNREPVSRETSLVSSCHEAIRHSDVCLYEHVRVGFSGSPSIRLAGQVN